MRLVEIDKGLATRSTSLAVNSVHTDGLRVVYEESFSLSESANDERVGEGAMVGRRDSSVEGVGVGEGCANRTKSSTCNERENRLGRAAVCLFSEGGIPLVGVGETGEDISGSEKEEPRFLDEQVLRVSGGLREVEEARARFWGGEREAEGSDMVRGKGLFSMNSKDGTDAGVGQRDL